MMGERGLRLGAVQEQRLRGWPKARIRPKSVALGVISLLAEVDALRADLDAARAEARQYVEAVIEPWPSAEGYYCRVCRLWLRERGPHDGCPFGAIIATAQPSPPPPAAPGTAVMEFRTDDLPELEPTIRHVPPADAAAAGGEAGHMFLPLSGSRQGTEYTRCGVNGCRYSRAEHGAPLAADVAAGGEVERVLAWLLEYIDDRAVCPLCDELTTRHEMACPVRALIAARALTAPPAQPEPSDAAGREET